MSVTIEENSSTAARRRRPMPPRAPSNIREKRGPRIGGTIGDPIPFAPSRAAAGAITRLRLRSFSSFAHVPPHPGIAAHLAAGPRIATTAIQPFGPYSRADQPSSYLSASDSVGGVKNFVPGIRKPTQVNTRPAKMIPVKLRGSSGQRLVAAVWLAFVPSAVDRFNL